MSNMKTYIVHVINEQEIKMKIRAHDIEEVKDLIENDELTDYIEDDEDNDDLRYGGRRTSDPLVSIEANKGFKVRSKPWTIKSIRKSSLKEEL